MITFLFITTIVIVLGVALYLTKEFLIAQHTAYQWFTTGQEDAEEGRPFDPPLNIFSSRHYRQGYYPAKNRRFR